MNNLKATILGMTVVAISPGAIAEEIETLAIGDVEIVYDYQPTESGLAILTLAAAVTETNDSLRGLKNSDPRRLGKLGQLIYQCKLVIYRSKDGDEPSGAGDPVLISRNYSLFTGVDLPLAAGERVGIQVKALRAVDEASLFGDRLGETDAPTRIWETVGDGSPLDLRQIDVNLLKENDSIEGLESIDIVIRFPVFQLEKPVNQWSYNFRLGEFKQAVRRIDEDCNPARFDELIKSNS